MQVIASDRPVPGRPSRAAVGSAIVVGAALLTGASWILILVLGAGFLDQFTPTGLPSTYQVVAGALAWTFALTAPAGLGIVGLARLHTALVRYRARRPRITPAVRLAHAIGDDHIVATGLRLPDGSRFIPELVVGPFGAAVVEELPPAGAVMSRGVRSWEVRGGSGTVRTIENPLERAARDGERVRAWLSPDDGDHRIKVYAAVVGVDERVARTAGCVVLAPDQVAPWLASLPPQRTFDRSRRERLVAQIRAAL